MTANSLDRPDQFEPQNDLSEPQKSADSTLESGPENDPSNASKIVRIPITEILDLHSVPARDAAAVLEEYLHECYRLNLTEIRIIHGRGIGVQRAMVRKILERTEFVVSFGDAPLEAGGWGATVATLLKHSDPTA